MNLTDVDDRIIAQAQKAELSIDDYTAKYIDAFGKTLTRWVRAARTLLRAPHVTFTEMADIDRKARAARPRLSIRRLDLLPHHFVSRIRKAFEDQL